MLALLLGWKDGGCPIYEYTLCSTAEVAAEGAASTHSGRLAHHPAARLAHRQMHFAGPRRGATIARTTDRAALSCERWPRAQLPLRPGAPATVAARLKARTGEPPCAIWVAVAVARPPLLATTPKLAHTLWRCV